MQRLSPILLKAYGYDGLDIDFEPNVDGVSGPLDEDPVYVAMLLRNSANISVRNPALGLFSVLMER